MNRRVSRRVLRVGATSPAWVPSALSGVLVWLRADTGVTDVSGKASAWANRIAGDTNTNLSQGTAGLRPTIIASDAAYNNQATLSGGATIFMASAAWATPLAQPFTWFAIGNDDGLGANEYYMEGNISGASRSILGSPVGTATYATYSGTELAGGTRGAAPRMLGGSNDNSATSSLYINSMTAVTTAGAGGVGTGNISGLTAFAAFTGAANLIGKLAEIIICSGVMSAADRALLRTYLNTRYAMSITA